MNVLPGETTAEDWSDDFYWFWCVMDHGAPRGIARTEKQWDSAGRVRPSGGDARWTYCEEHKDWEVSRRRITSTAALEYVHAIGA